MQELEKLIREAWEKLRAKIESDPTELAKRLARRRSVYFMRPQREWCLAIRAGDRRINKMQVRLEPEFGADERIPHRALITDEMLIYFNRPIEVPRGGDEHTRVAARLGCRASGLVIARATGKLAARYVRGLGGKHGKPVPIISCEKLLDPCRHGKLAGDPIRGEAWERAREGRGGVRGFEQKVQRVPIYWDRNLPRREQPARKHYRVPAPVPEHLIYPWVKPPKPKPVNQNPRQKRPRRGKTQGQGSLWFRGWSWICPGCGKRARMLYLPVFAVRAENLLDKKDPKQTEPDGYALPARALACNQCHGVRPWSTMCRGAWNRLVTQVSAGLLYGHEVPRPDWFRAERKFKYKPRINAPLARRREEVRERILLGWSNKQIARDLGVTIKAVEGSAADLYKLYRVKGRAELAGACGVKIEHRFDRACARREQVEHLLSAGQTGAEIARAIGSTRFAVWKDIRWLRRAGRVADPEAHARKRPLSAKQLAVKALWETNEFSIAEIAHRVSRPYKRVLYDVLQLRELSGAASTMEACPEKST